MFDDIVTSIQRCGVVLNTFMAPPFFSFQWAPNNYMSLCNLCTKSGTRTPAFLCAKDSHRAAAEMHNTLVKNIASTKRASLERILNDQNLI